MVLVATQVKRRRGTTAQNDAFTGAEGEITVDLENKELRVHTGDSKQGGYGTARKDFENITDNAKNIANWSSNVSNCITNIPQDIKLELNNGTLTLKTGSKVYVPNGSGVFDEVVIASDLSKTMQSADNWMWFYKYNGMVDRIPVILCFSGKSAPTQSQYMLWHDTKNNLIKYTDDTGSTWTSGNSFPFCETSPTSINQVFNGFGYIGSTVFALPGVKGLIPNGRNEDGSLKNTEFVVSNVQTSTQQRAKQSPQYITLNANTLSEWDSVYWMGYNADKNIVYNKNGSASATIGEKINLCICGIAKHTETTKITSFTIKTAFHALDYNDSEYIAHQAMPSDKYINLTLGASGTTYTAPADGWFISRQEYPAGGHYQVVLAGKGIVETFPNPCQQTFMIPVRKGQSILYEHSNVIPTDYTYFIFLYANGAQ